jgi:hypothetical protein
MKAPLKEKEKVWLFKYNFLLNTAIKFAPHTYLYIAEKTFAFYVAFLFWKKQLPENNENHSVAINP